MKRRHALLGMSALLAGMSAKAEVLADWRRPSRFTRPDLASDEGGLWALLDREESRLRRGPSFMREEELAQYLRGVCHRLAGEHAPDVRVYAVRTPYFNASMAPNGMMQVWSGLLLRVDNEAQLAAVLGHELGHYFERHTLKRLEQARATSAFAGLMGLFGLPGLVGGLLATAGFMSFSRDQERESDVIGARLLQQSGYSVAEAAKVWDNLLMELRESHGGDPSKRSVLFATHPPSQERADELRRLGEQWPGGEIGEERLREVLSPVMPKLVEDEIQRGEFGESKALFTRLIQREPGNALFWYARGEVQRRQDTPESRAAALADLQRAVQADPRFALAYRATGLLHRAANDNEQARKAFTQYLELKPDAVDAGMVRAYL